MAASDDAMEWSHWLARWDAMQTAYLPKREERFTVMLDVVADLVGDTFVAVDLACGPGAISQRLLARFPRARCVAVDYDPALLTLGRGALGDMGGRLRWMEADLRDPGWSARLGETRVDAVLSTTALHWLEAGELARLYEQLGALLRHGGVFLNGDHMPFAPHQATLRALAKGYVARRDEAFATREGQVGDENWRGWWTAFAAAPGMAELVAERNRRFAFRAKHGQIEATDTDESPTAPQAETDRQDDDEKPPIAEFHEAALRNAGFREVGIIWRTLDDGVVLGVR